MFFCRSTIALVILLGTGVPSPAAVADSQSLFRVPCTISYDGGASITTSCLVKSIVSQEEIVSQVQALNGKTFIVENDPSDGKWYLDHKAALKVSEEPNPCYQSKQLKLCF